MALAHPASRTGGVSYTAVLPGGSAPADGQFADVAVLRLTAPAPAGREPARLRPCGPARGRTVGPRPYGPDLQSGHRRSARSLGRRMIPVEAAVRHCPPPADAVDDGSGVTHRPWPREARAGTAGARGPGTR
ncbi:hypothetical protein [Streptomyces herbicida]|uniref:hypothetical protein n=1 Tax=Streptomyces herbicida TaxID=3065675 RepID=UPI00292D74A2|nr:hypothetical protein [Streptomyces sp. NEAU-HV9]